MFQPNWPSSSVQASEVKESAVMHLDVSFEIMFLPCHRYILAYLSVWCMFVTVFAFHCALYNCRDQLC
jgi:hypothetical protein